MNYLELCQAARQEAGESGGGPVAVTSQTGMSKKFVDWIARAWLAIQRKRNDWLFMLTSATFNTTASVGEYTGASLGLTDLGSFAKNGRLKIYETASGVVDEGTIPFIEYAQWRAVYDVGSVTPGRPVAFSISPSGSLLFGPAPGTDYTVTVDYYTAPERMLANTDTPALPPQYHEAIIYRALMYYAAHEEAPNVYADAQARYDEIMNAVEVTQLPPITIGSPAL